MEKPIEQLVFATNNLNKAEEIGRMVKDLRVITMREAGVVADIPETADSLEGNARLKANFLFAATGLNCFADDTGLEVEALGGRPGVHSARYAGPENDTNRNIEKLLYELKDAGNRKARFRTVIVLILNGDEFIFEGEAEGVICKEKAGTGGFGYDPVFFSTEKNKTFAELTPDEKNEVSHRGRAMQKLIDFLETGRKILGKSNC